MKFISLGYRTSILLIVLSGLRGGQAVTSGFVNVGPDRIYYEAAGAGPALIMIHDGLVHSRVWDEQFSFFSKDYRVVRYDRRGYGESSGATVEFTDGEDLSALFAHLKIERACLMGMSAGGRLAIDFALKYPEKVDSLILVGAVVNGFSYTNHFYSRGGHLPPDLKTMTQRVAYYAAEDPNEIYAENKAAKRKVKDLVTRFPRKTGLHPSAPPEAGPAKPSYLRLGEIKVPALILVGEHDIPDVQAHAGAINAGISNSKREIIAGSGHLIPIEQPEAFNQAVMRFLKGRPESVALRPESSLYDLTEFIRQDRLSERVLVVKTGVDYFDAVTAVKTRKGIVMIDAGYSPTLTKQYRAIVEREFPGTAIAYVINTHSHGDHTGGNGVFPEAVVIGHDTVPAEMGKDFSDQTRKLASLRSMIAGLKDEMNDPHLESEAKRKAVCRWRLLSRVLTDLEGDYRWTAPTLTFKDSMTLQMGDVTFKMRFFGRAHSGSDIVIEVPEEKLLMAGDLFNEGGSGNLSELNHGNVQQGDIEQWHDSMEYLLRAGPNYEHILDGHAAALSRDDLAAFGKNVEYLWNEYRSGRNYSARVRLAEVLKESGLEAMKSEYHRIKTARPNPYYFFESEFIDFGSHLLQGGEAAAAVEAFRIAAGEFPRSWRAWDWLGEACLTNGDRSTSIVSYEKSLQLNPNNDHARRTLEKMRAR